MIKAGNIFEITLTDKRRAIGHYIHWDDKNGPLIQVFNYIAYTEVMKIEDAVKTSYLFPPILTGLKAAVKEGIWPIIGKIPVKEFIYPKFISAHWNDKTGEVKNWFLYDGTSFNYIGPVLPEEYKALEYLVVWNPRDVIYRIETGNTPFPYGEMIKKNKFTPLPNMDPTNG